MRSLKSILGLATGISILAMLLGCTASNSGKAQPFVYYTKFPPGIKTLDAAQKDLAACVSDGKDAFRIDFGPGYHTQKGIEKLVWKYDPQELVKDIQEVASFTYNASHELTSIGLKRLAVLDDGFKVSPRIFIFYEDLYDFPITVGFYNGMYAVGYPNFIAFNFRDRDRAQRFSDDLYFMQQMEKKEQGQRWATFESQAARYHTLTVKPQVSEEQRKYIVQANALNQSKDYAGAIHRYLQALDLDPVAYPGAYFNLALLSAQAHRFRAAVRYMKQYLLLEPDANDARGAQDKIYEWEQMVPQPFDHMATTQVSTEPPDAFLEVNFSESGKPWSFLGRAPSEARFGCTDPKLKLCLIRASKPGYATEEKSFRFESLPAKVHFVLRPSDSGQDSHGFFGVRYQITTVASAKPADLQGDKGALVQEVIKGSPADQAGLESGDILLAIDGQKIHEMIDLPRTVAARPIGEAVDVNFLRNGENRTVTLKIGVLPN
jgi:tetratricopeptide (TPR) repeat protein